MTGLSQKLFAMLLMVIGVSYASTSLLDAVPPEPADGTLLICGLAIGLFIARQRLIDEQFRR